MGAPCTVGLTGGLASGKSSVAAVLAGWGIPVFDADRAVHRLYGPGEAGAQAVATLFGSGVLDSDGGIDRVELASTVLEDEEALDLLNRTVHPLVRNEIDLWLQGLDTPIAVVEAALLVETGAASRYDVLVVVACTPQQQLGRAVVRGVPEDRAVSILAAQAPMETKAAGADIVINNSGPVEDLEAEVEQAWQQIVSLCSERCVAFD
jgi:dephospho-CoA kinase